MKIRLPATIRSPAKCCGRPNGTAAAIRWPALRNRSGWRRSSVRFKGYGGGAARCQITRGDDDRLTTKLLWKNHRVLKTKLDQRCCERRLRVRSFDGVLECVDLQTGQRDAGLGQRSRARPGATCGRSAIDYARMGRAAVRCPSIRAEYKELGSFQALDGKTWNNPAPVGDLLLCAQRSRGRLL